MVLFFIMSPIWPLGQNPIPGDPFIIINKTTNELAFFQKNELQHIYQVGTGRTDDLTPEGLFTVTVKAKNPYYRKLDIPGGDSNNPLGTRWIGFDAEETDGRIYGIHGTNRAESIGYYVSNGCVRMTNPSVEELFDRIPLGTKVLIINKTATFEEIAIEYQAVD